MSPARRRRRSGRRGEKDALWFDPLKTHSNAPSIADSTKAQGILTGGQQQIESFAAPVTNGAKRVGRGSISAQLKYTSKKEQSYDVTVSGVPGGKEKASAEKAAKAFVKEKIDIYGDVDDTARQAGESLEKSYPGAKVSITIKPKAVVDTGGTSFYYKIRGNAGILLDIQAIPVAENQKTIGGSKTTGSTTEGESSTKTSGESSSRDIDKKVTDAEKTKASSREAVEATYNESVVKSLDDYVSKSETVHKEVASELVNHVLSDSTYRDKDHWESKRKAKDVTDYTKGVEKGERLKENWPAKIKKVIGIAKKITELPIKLPKWARRVKGWWLDAAEWVAGQFAESGKVQYEDTTAKSDRNITDDTDVTRDRDVTRHDDTTSKRTLEESYLTTTKDDWQRHLDEVTKISKEYRSLTTKESQSTTDKEHDEKYREANQKEAHEAADKHREVRNQTVTANFSVQQTTTFSVPVVKATVVNGDAEVSASPFGPDPDETAAPAGAPTSTPAPAP